jgi:hypothetical protein
MSRLVILFLGVFITSIAPSWAAGEIGYVENFRGSSDRYIIHRGAQDVPLRLCLPLYADDKIEALDDNGRVTLRLMDHPQPVIWSIADKDNKLSTAAPKASFWSDVLGSTLAALSPFDDQKRERVLTTIRGDGGDFGLPMLREPQILSAGQRSIALGWIKSSAVTDISITAKDGRMLVKKAKGTGGLWISPKLELRPGQYHVVVAAGANEASGTINVVASGEMPQVPAELTQASIPEPLSHTAQAIWLAGQQSGQYRLEALQRVANDRTTRPAAVLIEVLIAGKAIELQK